MGSSWVFKIRSEILINMSDECTNQKTSRLNYYGCMARRLFLVLGVAISFSLSFFSHLVPVPPLAALGAVVVLVFLSGFMPAKME